MTGLAFEDRPLALPLQINFRMAMLSASTELGRSCGKMEAYGWRMGSSEQARVDQIFTATVEAMRHQGYFIQSEAPAAVSRDITIFTADRLNQHYIFMWSAGEVGLVMVVCESSPPLTGRAAMASGRSRAEGSLSAQDVLQSAPAGKSEIAKGAFTPVGVWKGEYTCLPQGYTAATLQVFRLQGDNFEGDFHFYPTAKNGNVPEGRYEVYGQYDRKSHRILINPGKWLRQPRDYANSVMVGSFDPATRTFSAYFQGVNGCTSFEAKYASGQTRFGAAKTNGKTAKKHGSLAPQAGSKKRDKKSSHSGDSLKSLRPVIIGGTGKQGNAAPLPSTRQKIDQDFYIALKSEGDSDHPYAKLEEEAPRYATEVEEKAPRDNTPAAQFYILPSQSRASEDSPAETKAGKSGWRSYLTRKKSGGAPPVDSEATESSDLTEYVLKSDSGVKPLGAKASAKAKDNPEAAGLSETLPPQTEEGDAVKKQPGEQPAAAEKDKPQSALTPMPLLDKPIKLASSGQWISPQAPSAPGPSIVSPVAMSAPGPSMATQRATNNPVAPTASGPTYVSAPATRNYVAPEAPAPNVILPPSGTDIVSAAAPAPSIADPRPSAAPDPAYAQDFGGRP